MTTDARGILEKTPFFADVLDASALDVLAEAAVHEEFDQGSVLIREREPGESLFVIAQGAVTVAVHDGGSDRRVATLHDGAIVGEISLLTGARRSATVTALRPTVTLEIAKPALQPILENSPALADLFAHTIERRKAELEALYGPASWMRHGLSASELAARIRRFFSLDH